MLPGSLNMIVGRLEQSCGNDRSEIDWLSFGVRPQRLSPAMCTNFEFVQSRQLALFLLVLIALEKLLWWLAIAWSIMRFGPWESTFPDQAAEL